MTDVMRQTAERDVKVFIRLQRPPWPRDLFKDVFVGRLAETCELNRFGQKITLSYRDRKWVGRRVESQQQVVRPLHLILKSLRLGWSWSKFENNHMGRRFRKYKPIIYPKIA